MTNRFINDLTRAEVLAELRSYTEADGAYDAKEVDGTELTDLDAFGDEALRELLKLARWQAMPRFSRPS